MRNLSDGLTHLLQQGVSLGVRCDNRDEDTYAPEDLFDHLYRIDSIREDNTQAEIAEKMGEEWSRSDVSNHAVLLNNIATGILESAREHQVGHVADDATNVAIFNFTEGWFRTSGIYDLNGCNVV